jgi:hypothetical protein
MSSANDLTTGLAATTMVWSLFVPGLADVKDMELAEFRRHELIAVGTGLGVIFLIAGMANDPDLVGIGVAVLAGLVGAYEWKIWAANRTDTSGHPSPS